MSPQKCPKPDVTFETSKRQFIEKFCQQDRACSGAARTSRKGDRIALLSLTKALRISKGRLKRDSCGDWNIFGRRGHISTDGSYFYVYVQVGSRRRWEAVKRTLNFLSVTQDGDDEGVVKICEMPTAEQAAVIRKVLGSRKAMVLTERQRETITRRLNLRPRNEAISGENTGAPRAPATTTPAGPRNAKNNQQSPLEFP